MGPPRLPNLQLTSSELEALSVYEAFVARHGHAPGVRAYARELGCQPSWAWRLLRSFATKNALPPIGRGPDKTTHVRIKTKPERKRAR